MNATCIHARYQAQVALQDTVAWLAGASHLGPQVCFLTYSQEPRIRGQSEPPPPPCWLSRQKQTLNSSVWEGSRSCFHFIPYSSRTVSHRHEEPQKQHSPSPTAAPQKQGLREKCVSATSLTSMNRQSLPQKKPGQGKQQKSKTATS